MAIVREQKIPTSSSSAYSDAASSLSVTFGTTTVTGNTIVCGGGAYLSGGAPTLTISDSGTHSWSYATNGTDSTVRGQIGYVLSITGRASHAEHDVVTVARDRWPAVHFVIRNTAVQGPNTVPQVVEALRELDADPDVDVIVIARGGGSVEDLLPFYDETLCREIAKCTTPVVSAIGHEPDNPLCDLVADLRAATPTDAAKRIVPDAAAEQALITDLCRRGGAIHLSELGFQGADRSLCLY